MKAFLSRLRRLFWSWRMLKFFLWSATLIVFFYVEEDWRGAHAWAVTKAKWEARGESFDLHRLVPSPIPDAENLGALPIFRLERIQDSKGASYLDPVALRHALGILDDAPLPSTGDWMRGEPPDLEKIRAGISTEYHHVFPKASVVVVKPQVAPGRNTIDVSCSQAAEALSQLSALYPSIIELRAASASRPLCRFPYDDTTKLPSARSLGLTTSQIQVSRILTLDAVLALKAGRADLALADLDTIHELESGLRRDPNLVSGLVAIGINAISTACVYQGLVLHAWNDQQLARIEDGLAQPDFLADYQFDLRGEAVQTAADFDYFKRPLESNLDGLFTEAPSLSNRLFFLWPTGWWDQNKAQVIDHDFHLASATNPRSHRVLPERIGEDQVAQRRTGFLAYAPWNIFFTLVVPPLLQTPITFSEGQVSVDEARVACALERYRLANHNYPDALDELAPAFITAVPPDPLSGRPYRYWLRPDSTFLLYSVGWNQADDGGKVAYMKENPRRTDPKQGDWVWPTPEIAARFH